MLCRRSIHTSAISSIFLTSTYSKYNTNTVSPIQLSTRHHASCEEDATGNINVKSEHEKNSASSPLYTVLRTGNGVDVKAWLGISQSHKNIDFASSEMEDVVKGLAALQNSNISSSSSISASVSNTSQLLSDSEKKLKDLEKLGGHTNIDISSVELEREACRQLLRLSTSLPSSVLQHPVAIMPDVHFGNGTTVGTVIPTTKAVIPSSVGVDIGCGMLAIKTSLKRRDLPENLSSLRLSIEVAVPHGRTHNGTSANDAGGWRDNIPKEVALAWQNEICDQIGINKASSLERRFQSICTKTPGIERSNNINHLGTLGTGNHFIELCVEKKSPSGFSPSSIISLNKLIDKQESHKDVFGPRVREELQKRQEEISKADDNNKKSVEEGTESVWIMLHSGSRGVGGRIGSTFIELAKKDMLRIHGADDGSNFQHGESLAYLSEGTEYFDQYIEAVSWAQDFARVNRELMAQRVIRALRSTPGLRDPNFTCYAKAVNCHHNYVERYYIDSGIGVPPSMAQQHDTDKNKGTAVWLTRKGATSARRGELAIIPGNMGTRSYIVEGTGKHLHSYNSCSHGAGRRYSRGEAKRRFTVNDHEHATDGVECRKDADVVDETPMAYKDIDHVMAAQRDLVEVVCVLKQILCVKG